jgi:diguanylate cyclase (GGDEF)-like protein
MILAPEPIRKGAPRGREVPSDGWGAVNGTDGHAGRWLSHLPALRRDPILLAMVAWTLLATVLFVTLAGRTEWQVLTFWAFMPPLDAVLPLSAWRIHRIATGATRRFWLVLTGSGLLLMAGDSVQAVLTAVDPAGRSTAGDTVQTVCFVVGLAMIVLAMLAHPHPNRSGRDRLAFWLDSATVLVGGAVLAWCFVGSHDNPDIVGTLVGTGVCLTSAFAAIKMIMSGNAPMHKIAALVMLGAAVTMSVGIFLSPLAGTRLAPLVFVTQFLPSLFIAAGPRIQEVIAQIDPAPFGRRNRKPYSLLPYGSMAAAFGTLIAILPYGVNARLWGVVLGLGVICALVAVRQLVAFHENSRLIRQLREHDTRLRHQALFDGLTGLANRVNFHEQAAAALAGGGPVGLLLIDLDGFKAVNDTRGHAAGDALLAGVAEKLRTTVRSDDLPARLGGDEFAVLLPGVTAGEAEQVAARILAAFRTPVPIGDEAVPVNASIGVADAAPGDDVESLLREADLAMYAAKNGGKGTWMHYEAGMESMLIA